MSVFWNAIHTVRAGAFFKKALDSNSNKDVRDQYKKSHKISEKVLLSGVILATSALLLTRSIYRAIKRHHQKKKAQKQFSNTIAPPIQNNNSTQKPIYQPDTYSDRIKQSDKILNDAKKENGTTSPITNDIWSNDIPLTDKQWQVLRELKLYKVIDNKCKLGTCYLQPQSHSENPVGSIFVNGSGIWAASDENNSLKDKDKKKGQEERTNLLDNNNANQIIKLTRLSQFMDYFVADENYNSDVLKICDIIHYL